MRVVLVGPLRRTMPPRVLRAPVGVPHRFCPHMERTVIKAGTAGLCRTALFRGRCPTWGGFLAFLIRHPGEGRDLAGASGREGEIPAFAGMTTIEMAAFGRNAAFYKIRAEAQRSQRRVRFNSAISAPLRESCSNPALQAKDRNRSSTAILSQRKSPRRGAGSCPRGGRVGVRRAPNSVFCGTSYSRRWRRAARRRRRGSGLAPRRRGAGSWH